MNEKNVITDAVSFAKMYSLGDMSFSTYDQRGYIVKVEIEKYQPEETEEEDEE